MSKYKFFLLLPENLQNITTEMVIFTICFFCLLFVGSYVCKFVRQSVGWDYVWYWVCLFVGWWLCFNSRDGVSTGIFQLNI